VCSYIGKRAFQVKKEEEGFEKKLFKRWFLEKIQPGQAGIEY
jgi:hypothetical protein